MPVMPSFTGFGATPNLAEAFIGGESTVQNAINEQDSVKLNQQKLAQAAQIAQMEHDAKMAAIASQAQRDQAELAFNKAYHDQLIGLQSRELNTKQQLADLAGEEQTQKQQGIQQWNTGVDDLLRSGKTPQQAVAIMAASRGPAAGLHGEGMASMMREPATIPQGVQNIDDTHKVFYDAKGNAHILTPPTTPEHGELPTGMVWAGNRAIEDPAYAQLIKDREKVDAYLRSPQASIAKGFINQKNKNLGMKSFIEDYNAQLAIKADLDKKIASYSRRKEGPVSTNSPSVNIKSVELWRE